VNSQGLIKLRILCKSHWARSLLHIQGSWWKSRCCRLRGISNTASGPNTATISWQWRFHRAASLCRHKRHCRTAIQVAGWFSLSVLKYKKYCHEFWRTKNNRYRTRNIETKSPQNRAYAIFCLLDQELETLLIYDSSPMLCFHNVCLLLPSRELEAQTLRPQPKVNQTFSKSAEKNALIKGIKLMAKIERWKFYHKSYITSQWAFLSATVHRQRCTTCNSDLNFELHKTQ